MADRLAGETSPYLRQHVDNPVDWWPWGDDAFAEARRRDVPVLLSVGYSACHWCHVMAHESFEDEATAAVLNEGFVSIKVDREERPDVDAVYMEAVQAMSGAGGWPMTVLLDHDGLPFFAGTYFPKDPHPHRPSFTQLLSAASEAWSERRDELRSQGDQLAAAIAARTAVAPAGEGDLTVAHVDAAVDQLVALHDPVHGGFGRAPKFPQPTFGELLLQAWRRTGRDDALAAVSTTLDAMAAGGIYDHLGGGFSRYSTDERWLVPHFEKMLYDQALLARLYLHGFQATGDPGWLQVVDETLTYVLRDLGLPGGGLASAEDADSEGVEGRFYVWTEDEVRAAAGEDADEAVAWWGVTPEGNWEGRTILTRQRGDLLRPPSVEQARAALLEARSRRVRPGLDDKVLTEWNAMAVAVLAEAGAATVRPAWIESAERIARFLLDELRRPDGRWLRSWQADAGRARHLAYAVDHAWLVEAFTRLAEATGRPTWIHEARDVADDLLALFWDDAGGGFFTTGADAEPLIVRPKDVTDGATPSANAVAARALLRLGALTGGTAYSERAMETLRLLAGPMAEQPSAFTGALAAVDLAVRGITEVVIAERRDLVDAVQRRYLPEIVLAWGDPFRSPLWEGRYPGLAFVCHDFRCERPAERLDDLLAQLRAD